MQVWRLGHVSKPRFSQVATDKYSVDLCWFSVPNCRPVHSGRRRRTMVWSVQTSPKRPGRWSRRRTFPIWVKSARDGRSKASQERHRPSADPTKSAPDVKLGTLGTGFINALTAPTIRRGVRFQRRGVIVMCDIASRVIPKDLNQIYSEYRYLLTST